MKIEENALQKESDKASKERLEKLTGEIGELEAKSAALTAQWQAEKDKLAGAQKLKEKLDQARSELEIAQRERSEEHTSELQSLMRISYAVFCLKKKNTRRITQTAMMSTSNQSC